MFGLKHTLSDQTVQVLIVGALKTEVSSADVVDSLVINHERTIGVLEGGVSGQDRVVWLDNGGSSLRSWVDTELQLDLLTEVDRQTLHEESTETRSSSTTKRVEYKETLETRAIIGNTANLVQNLVNQLLADSVVTTSIIVRGILLARDHQFRVEQAAVGTGADFIDDIGLKIAVDGSGNVFALTCSAEIRQRNPIVYLYKCTYRSRRRKC
jgi:hypothetical protein